MRFRNFIYMIACIPAYIAYKIISINNVRIKEDFNLNRKHHSRLRMNEYTAFCYMMQNLPEYRFVLYNRMPVFLGFILSIILPKRRVYFNVKNLEGVGKYNTWMVYNCLC